VPPPGISSPLSQSSKGRSITYSSYSPSSRSRARCISIGTSHLVSYNRCSCPRISITAMRFFAVVSPLPGDSGPSYEEVNLSEQSSR
jgi:hypothetical protein